MKKRIEKNGTRYSTKDLESLFDWFERRVKNSKLQYPHERHAWSLPAESIWSPTKLPLKVQTASRRCVEASGGEFIIRRPRGVGRKIPYPKGRMRKGMPRKAEPYSLLRILAPKNLPEEEPLRRMALSLEGSEFLPQVVQKEILVWYWSIGAMPYSLLDKHGESCKDILDKEANLPLVRIMRRCENYEGEK